MFFRDGSVFKGSSADKADGHTIIVPVCGRCGGAGWIEGYRHVEGGICFQCRGSCRGTPKSVPIYTGEKLAKLNAARDKKAAAEKAKNDRAYATAQAEISARRGAFLAEHKEVLAWLEVAGRDSGRAFDGEDVPYRDGFLGDMLRHANKKAHWTPAQELAVYASFEKDQARAVVRAASRHIGNVGDKLELVVTAERESTYVKQAFFKSFYHDNSETVYVTTMRTADGAAIVVKSTSFRVPVGDTLTISGIVKEHSEFNNEAQTVLNYVRIKTAKAVKTTQKATA
jgi:hypothetical protein